MRKIQSNKQIIFLYIISLMGLSIFSTLYVEIKDNILKKKAEKALIDLFDGRDYFVSHNYKYTDTLEYKITSIDSIKKEFGSDYPTDEIEGNSILYNIKDTIRFWGFMLKNGNELHELVYSPRLIYFKKEYDSVNVKQSIQTALEDSYSYLINDWMKKEDIVYKEDINLKDIVKSVSNSYYRLGFDVATLYQNYKFNLDSDKYSILFNDEIYSEMKFVTEERISSWKSDKIKDYKTIYLIGLFCITIIMIFIYIKFRKNQKFERTKKQTDEIQEFNVKPINKFKILVKKFFAWLFINFGLFGLVAYIIGFKYMSEIFPESSISGQISIIILALSLGIYFFRKLYFETNKMSVGKKILILIVYNIIAFIIAFIITYPVVKITEYDALSIIFFVILFALLLMFPNPEKSIFANKNNLNSFLNRLNKLDNVNEIQEDMNFGTHEESLVTHEEITDKPKVVSVSGNSTFGVFLKNNIFTGRIFHLNLGVQRLLLVIGIFLPLIISINKYEFFEYFPDDFFLVILFSILLFIGYWVIVRISLWIYDGFKEGDKNK